MEKKQIKLWDKEIPFYQDGAETPNTMELFLLDTQKKLPVVVIFPGGGYGMRAEHEAEPIARFYNSKGMHAIVVNYRVFPYRYPCALMDAQRAVKLTRYYADEWKLDAEKLFTLGFSAGGHLSACTAAMPDVSKIGDFLDNISARPNGAVLCYPMISAYEKDGAETYRCAAEHLLSEQTDLDWLSVQNHVTKDTPPCFLWHTSDDETVPLRHSLLFAQRLAENGVACELHVFPHGPHGLGLAKDYPDVSGWAGLSADWMRRNF